MVAYGDGEKHLFVFIPNPKCNQDFNETILETLCMSEKGLPQDEYFYKFRVIIRDTSILRVGEMLTREKK